jgi:hypothetical protein
MLFEMCFSLGTRLGEVPPLVGHNCMLRWEAMRQVAIRNDGDGTLFYWSEGATTRGVAPLVHPPC